MNDSPNRDVAVFTEVIQLPVGERAAYLQRACGNDGELRQRIEALLEAHDQGGDFLVPPAEKMLPQTRLGSALGENLGDRIGHFKLLNQIGEGGCGVVYLAEQDAPIRRQVALKVIKPGMDTKSVIARFEAERQALALMDHPNIAKVFDAGTTESGRPYFVMELVRGVKITEYCDGHSLTTDERLKLFVQVCHAVQHAHQKGIIHRDIKPSNILVTTTREGASLPVVIDFGIAKATNNIRLTDKTIFTAFEMIIGTPAYMSPEQAALDGTEVDTRTDIYSLGVLLYELLAGSTPYGMGKPVESGPDEIRRVIREQEPTPPSARLKKMAGTDLTTLAHNRKSEPFTLIRSIRGDLDWIAMKAMEKDRTRRYATAHGLALDIQHYLEKEPVSARPPSTFYKFQKLVLRNRPLFAGIGIILLLLVASLIIVSTLLARERRSRRDAEAASAKSQQVTQFLEDMLNGVGPSVSLGQDTKMLRGILDRTVERVGKELTNQPAVEAELRDLIGGVYFDLGEYPQAEQMQRASLALNRKLYSPESKEAAASLNNLGVTFWRESKQPEAEAALREALDIRRRNFGDQKSDLATSLINLANVYRHNGNNAEAEQLAQESLAIRQGLYGKESVEAADSLRVLGILFGDEAKWSDSEATLQDVLAIRRKQLGPEHPLIAASLSDVAWAAGHLGKWDEVESMQREAVNMQRKLLGDGHPAFTDSLHKLCGTLEVEGKYAEAEVLCREALTSWEQRTGSESPQALDELAALAHVLADEKKYGEAEQALDKVLTPYFIGQPSSANLLNQRVDLMARQGRWHEAATDASLVLKYQPDDHLHYHQLAPLLAMTHDRLAYQQLCREVIVRFANTTDMLVADRASEDCLLLPDSGVDLGVADKLADIAVNSGSNNICLPFFQACKAMSCYRRGRFLEALGCAQKALETPLACAQVKACAILAMAHWQLGQKDAARAMLKNGERLASGVFSVRDPDLLREGWVAWLHARVSLDEATGLIQLNSTAKGHPNQP